MAEAADQQGIQTAPVRRWARRAATTLLAAAPLLGGALPAATAAPGTAAPNTAAPAAPAAQETAPAAGRGTGSRTVDVTVNSLTPAAPAEGGTVTLRGTVTNDGDATVTPGHVGLRVGAAPLGSRSAIEQASKRTGYLPGADGYEADGEHRAKVTKLAPGITRSFALKVPVEDLRLGENGVYQLGVSFTGGTKALPYDRVLGIERTFLPWRASEEEKATRLTSLWPLISSSHLTARTESDEQQTPVFRNDDLYRAIAPGGRLQQMVALGADLPITWVIDADLLAGVDAMTKPYKVRTEDGGTVEGKGQVRAKQWLKNLQDAVKGEEIVALPFADPDLASLAHQGREVPGALGRLGPATTRAEEAIEVILHTTPSTDFAWPVRGAVDSSIVDAATSAGAHNVLARSDSIREADALPYTPTAARPIGGGNTAVVADHGLSTAFSGDMTRAAASTRAVQGFLSHTLAITNQDPGKQRSIVVAPQRRPTVSQARTMAEALRALNEHGGWTKSTSLSEAAKAKPDAAANRSVPRPRDYPGSLREDELSTEAFQQIQQTQETLDEFSVILSRDDRVAAPFGSAIDRQVSTAWRGEPEAAAEYRESVQEYLVGLTHKVGLIEKSDLTLSGRSATIPVTVQNNLAQGVDGLKLKLRSSRSIGLEIEDDMQPVVVEGGHSQSVKFSTSAKANGRTTMEAQLYTRDGKPYGPPMTFQVKVTSITSTVLLVIAGGVLLVVLAGIRMYTQRKRMGAAPDPDAPLHMSQQPEEAAEPEGEPETETDTEPENAEKRGQPGEGTGDTAAGSSDPPETGEKVDR